MKTIQVFLNEKLCLTASEDWMADILTWIRHSPYNFTVKIQAA